MVPRIKRKGKGEYYVYFLGLGLEDIGVAIHVYNKALKKGIGKNLLL